MSDEAPKSEIILYNTEDGKTRLDVKMEGETVWLTQAQMAELFQTHLEARLSVLGLVKNDLG